jgi:hypothetical protein
MGSSLRLEQIAAALLRATGHSCRPSTSPHSGALPWLSLGILVLLRSTNEHLDGIWTDDGIARIILTGFVCYVLSILYPCFLTREQTRVRSRSLKQILRFLFKSACTTTIAGCLLVLFLCVSCTWEELVPLIGVSSTWKISRSAYQHCTFRFRAEPIANPVERFS